MFVARNFKVLVIDDSSVGKLLRDCDSRWAFRTLHRRAPSV
jgi:hypothetical protein